VRSKTLRTVPSGSTAAYIRQPSSAARVWTRNSAFTPDESQNLAGQIGDQRTGDKADQSHKVFAQVIGVGRAWLRCRNATVVAGF
jgi:hypothetical protein